jgi:hypothetical protein
MRTKLEKLKLPLEIASAIIGLVIGANTLWWQVQQLLPPNPLVGSVVATEARLPGDLLAELKALPGSIGKALGKNKDLAKLLPNETTLYFGFRGIYRYYTFRSGASG